MWPGTRAELEKQNKWGTKSDRRLLDDWEKAYFLIVSASSLCCKKSTKSSNFLSGCRTWFNS